MNQTERTLVRYGTWTFEQFSEHFVSKRDGRSLYAQGKDFAPDVLGEINPKQLHYTETHDGRIPVRMWMGAQDLRGDVVAMLEVKFPHSFMDGLMNELKQHDLEKWTLIHKLAWRNKGVKRGEVYSAIGVPKSTAERWFRQAMGFMSDELDKVIGQMAKEGQQPA